ncbi:MAG: hypothetical protein CME88_11620 [Hirschia sp.]|nr:hypothetical protein [Hirschia sp.]MBF19018.1 hypothetical protein [Hirschia sp.]|tara:strand:- start:180 stop:1238 length:1059 start_codon:yes stop_codon:yes gene_type:complete
MDHCSEGNAVQLYYVDDNKADIYVMSKLFRSEEAVQLNSSSCLESLLEIDGLSDADCVFLDVMRPDSFSMEADLAALRTVTDAPVYFITSCESAPVRERAIKSGAEGLIEKGRLNKEVIFQIASNAIARRRSCEAVHAKSPDMTPTRSTRNSDNDAFVLAARTLSSNLSLVHGAIEDEPVSRELRGKIKDAAELADALDNLQMREVDTLERVNLRDVCASVQSDVEESATRNGVTFVWDVKPSCYLQKGSMLQARSAVRHLCKAAISLAEDNASILFTAMPTEDGNHALIQLYSANFRLPSNWSKASPCTQTRPAPMELQASLAMALELFNLPPDQLNILYTHSSSIIQLKI